MTAATKADTRPDLSERLAHAQREEEPLLAEVQRLEHELAAAIADRAFVRAHKAQQALPRAREEAAIASATVGGLQAAVDRVRQAQAADEEAIEQAKQREQARQEHETWAAKVSEHDAACREELAAAAAGLEAVRASYQAAHAHGQAADEAKQQVHRCNVIMGHTVGPPPTRSNYARAVIERDPLLAAVVRGRI